MYTYIFLEGSIKISIYDIQHDIDEIVMLTSPDQNETAKMTLSLKFK